MMKILEKVVEKNVERKNRGVGKSVWDYARKINDGTDIFFVGQLIEKYGEKMRNLAMVFIEA